jgi:hypothetical protein
MVGGRRYGSRWRMGVAGEWESLENGRRWTFTPWDEVGTLCSLNMVRNATADVSRKYGFVKHAL